MFDIVLGSPARSGVAAGDYSRCVEARWWTIRPAQSLKPASYVCPFCDGMLHATSEHALVAPEGDVSRRRHAHLDCVREAHRAGRFTTEDEWRQQQKTEKKRR